MRAVKLVAHGSLDNLVYDPSYPDPKPGPGEVVVRVRACSLNYHDVFTVRGMPGIKVPLPVVIGCDIAGEVAALGAGVSGWKSGDPVLINPLHPKRGLMGEMLDGGFAEYTCCMAEQLVAIPTGVTFAEAASLPVAYGTAHRMMLTNGHIKAGETVLILGASGGVGTCCVQLARMMGCEVIACASSEEKLARLKELGADHVLDYTKEDFSKWVLARYGKPQRRSFEGGVDVIVNYTGGDTWVPSLRALKRGGRLLTCGATVSYDPKEDIRYIWTFELKVLGSNSWTVGDLEALLAMVREKRMHIPIDKTLPLAEAAEAVRILRDREVFGKVVVVP